MKRYVLITGATGKTGSHAARELLQGGHRVRALVHRPDARSDRLASQGAEIVIGDLLDLDAVARAAAGVEAMYLTFPIAPGLLEASAIAMQAAEENGLSHIVNMSQISARRDAASNAARQHWIAERMLDHFAGAVTHLRPTFFAEWLLNFWNETTGEIRLPFGDSRHAPIAAEDQGRVIAALLTDPGPHVGKSYQLLGPTELNHRQIATAMSHVLSRQVTYVPIELDEFELDLKSRGMSEHFIQHLVNVAVDYRNGVFSGTNDVVQCLTGIAPLSVENFVEKNIMSFRGAAATDGQSAPK